MGHVAALLPCGTRLHLQHGPIDLIIGAEGNRQAAFAAAEERFAVVLDELVAELPLLRRPISTDAPRPRGRIAQRMDAATRPFAGTDWVTPMAAVAGSVADTVLGAMTRAVALDKAYVNNGGDIAIHLSEGQSFTMAMASHDGTDLGRIRIRHQDPVRGIATSGRHGRSLSLGMADSVTALAQTAAAADVAATLIANAVDLPGHPGITRQPATTCDPNSDLGDMQVVTACGPLSADDSIRALQAGRARAQTYTKRGLCFGAALFLQGHSEATHAAPFSLVQRTPEYA